jgi:hypothetical protein
MSKCNCPCCQVYGPIEREFDAKKYSKKIAKEAKENIARFKKEDPKAYQDLVDSLKKITGG